MIFEAKFLIHFYFIRQARQDQFISAVCFFTLFIAAHQFPCQSLMLIFRKYIQSQKHNILSFRIMHFCICKKIIRQMFSVRGKPIEKSCYSSCRAIFCYKKKLRCFFHTFFHVFIRACFIRRKTDFLNLCGLCNFLLTYISKNIFFS